MRGGIGNVFNWLDRLKHEKCAHPVSLGEIEKHKDAKVRNSFKAKLQSYNILQNDGANGSASCAVRRTDKTENDRNDTIIVNEVFADRVDILITEDRSVRTKAGILGIADRVFTLDAFLFITPTASRCVAIRCANGVHRKLESRSNSSYWQTL